MPTKNISCLLCVCIDILCYTYVMYATPFKMLFIGISKIVLPLTWYDDDDDDDQPHYENIIWKQKKKKNLVFSTKGDSLFGKILKQLKWVTQKKTTNDSLK